MLGQFDLITYDEPPSAIARRTQDALMHSIARFTTRFTTAMFPDSPSGNSTCSFDRTFQIYLHLRGK